MKICIYDIHHRVADEPEILAILTEERERRMLVRAQKAKVSKVP